jgi:ferredoxin-NADP reductase/Na+-transporting NADH:ubiquinone oxidoreductase subunit NqrB
MLNKVLAWRLWAAGLIDRFNDKLTSYRLMLYFLLVVLAWTVVGSLANQLAPEWYQIILSAGWLIGICYLTNKALAKFLDIPANRESYLISALILSLILTPAADGYDYLVLAGAAVSAIASKFLLVLKASHIFNPAALGAFVAGAVFDRYASWWVGNDFTAPLLLLGGILILRKIKRFSLFIIFCALYILLLVWNLPAGSSVEDIRHLVWLGLSSTSLLFFAVVMLTEPLTSPAKFNPILIYAAVVSVLYSVPELHASPEEALLAGNLVTFLISPNRRYKLNFIRRVHNARGIYSYVFSAPPDFKYQAGQYMEWTIRANHSDSRGNRRYFTISSSPTENELMFTIKIPPKPSAFKKQLEAMKPGEQILASYLAGSFTLPDDNTEKLALIAGGVGITPYRSMIKYLVDSDQKRDLAVLYAASDKGEFAFDDLFRAAEPLGIKSFFTTDFVDKNKLVSLPDWQQRTYYISGPQIFVEKVRLALHELGISPSRIRIDFFPGYN